MTDYQIKTSGLHVYENGYYAVHDVQDLVQEANIKLSQAHDRVRKFEQKREIINAALEHAEEKAASVVAEANQKAGQIEERARNNAEKIEQQAAAKLKDADHIIDTKLVEAKKQGDSILREAETEAKKLTDLAQSKHDEIIETAVKNATAIAEEIVAQTKASELTLQKLAMMRGDIQTLSVALDDVIKNGQKMKQMTAEQITGQPTQQPKVNAKKEVLERLQRSKQTPKQKVEKTDDHLSEVLTLTQESNQAVANAIAQTKDLSIDDLRKVADDLNSI